MSWAYYWTLCARSMMLAAHLYARTPAGQPADEATFEDALASAMREADGDPSENSCHQRAFGYKQSATRV